MELNSKSIRGKVASIISDQEVVLNRGADDGVTEGMYFKIIDPSTINITDPDTGEDLGGIQRIKVVVRAVEVAPRLTLARTFRTRTVNVGGAGMGSAVLPALNSMMKPPRYVEQIERLNIDPAESELLGLPDGMIAKGDAFETARAEDAELNQSVTIWE